MHPTPCSLFTVNEIEKYLRFCLDIMKKILEDAKFVLFYGILVFNNKCHQNVTGKLCQDEFKGPIRASQIVISSQDVYPVVKI